MADEVFEKALRRVLAIEKLYSNDPEDDGGETVWGVARKRNPNWDGWLIVDVLRKQPGFPENLRDDKALWVSMCNFYRKTFWIPLRCDQMPPLVADKVFEISVNVGPKPAAEILQVACNASGHPVVIDGVVGPRSVQATMSIEPAQLKTGLQNGQAGYYLGICAALKNKRRNKNGWLTRALT